MPWARANPFRLAAMAKADGGRRSKDDDVDSEPYELENRPGDDAEDRPDDMAAEKLPDDFEDEEIDEEQALEEGDEDLAERFNLSTMGADPEEFLEGADEEQDDDEQPEEDEDDDADDERRKALLEDMEGMNETASKKRKAHVRTEALPEKWTNAVGDGVSVKELMEAAGNGAGGESGSLRKKLRRLGTKAKPEEPPLPDSVRRKQERKAAYEGAKSEVSKFQGVVKANRERQTVDLRKEESSQGVKSTVGSRAVEHEPKQQVEQEVADLLRKAGADDEAKVTGGEELEMNGMSVDEAKRRKDRLAKMRALLFKYEERAKKMKRIKSKRFRRRERKAGRRQIDETTAGEEDSKKARELAEFDRAKERMTLKHRNTSRWAKRQIKKGLNKQSGSKEAVEEQLRIGEELMKRVDRRRADENEVEEEEGAAGTSSEGENGEEGKQAEPKTKCEALEVLQSGTPSEELPSKGLFSLPFIRRTVEKKRAEAQAAARDVLGQEGGVNDEWEEVTPRGQGESECREDVGLTRFEENRMRLTEEGGTVPHSHSHGQPARQKGVAVDSNGSNGDEARSEGKGAAEEEEEAAKGIVPEEGHEGEMGGVSTRQRELIRQAFAGDDVAQEFEREKEEQVAGELPEEEGEQLLPGWGQWASEQREPRFIERQRRRDQERREQAKAGRRDRSMPHVILSERYDKQAAKFCADRVPHPFRSRSAYDAAVSFPLGREFSTDAAFRDLTRPGVLTTPGKVINPIRSRQAS